MARSLAATFAASVLMLVSTEALAGRILPFFGEGGVIATPCSPDQEDPAACFALSSSYAGGGTWRMSTGGDAFGGTWINLLRCLRSRLSG